MELIHKLTYNGTSTTIQEPIGFDDLKTKIKRGDLHGISVEVSVGSLEFYAEAYDVIQQAYMTDIDSIISYSVTLTDGSEVYSGTLDLSTYSDKSGDYSSITCKVGDVGAKTTFNNRTDTDVDLNTDKTIDGANLGMQARWENIRIPMKHLKYTNSANQKKENVFAFRYGSTGVENDIIPFTLDNVTINEFGEVCNGTSIFAEDSDFDEKFGTGTEMEVDLSVKVSLNAASATLFSGRIYLWVVLKQGDNVLKKVAFPSTIDVGDYLILKYSGTISTDTPLQLWIREKHTADIGSWDFKAAVMTGESSYVKMSMYDNITDSGVSADMIQVHNALNVITGAISENALSVKSDWYGGWLSGWHKPSTAGGGHLKAITNGYKIRGLFTEGDTERNMPVSFKSMINSLNALDCIGWGFSKEDGADYVRVERWDWFFKDDVILNISGANETTISVDTDKVNTDLQIGYKKYETSSQYNSIDSVHGERSMKNAIKVVSKKISHLCEFIGDTYCIEETRRAKAQVDSTEEFKYDENTFIFELGYKGNTEYGSSDPVAPYIPNNVASSSGVDRPLEQYNVQLSPRRCAERWRSFLFACKNTTPYRFISGKINYKASFKCKQSNSTAAYMNEYLADYMGGQDLAENADIQYSKTKIKAETIKFSYPISLAEYKAIISNPYGQIYINGIFGWIKEMQYSFATGEADFTLIRKNS